MFELVTGTQMKPWLSRSMLSNINTCENGWLNFSSNLRVMSLKLLELTQFTWPNLSIYFNFLCASGWHHQEYLFSDEATCYNSTMGVAIVRLNNSCTAATSGCIKVGACLNYRFTALHYLCPLYGCSSSHLFIFFYLFSFIRVVILCNCWGLHFCKSSTRIFYS